MLIPDKAIHAEVFDQEKGAAFTVVYRDKDKIAWGKKIHIRAFIETASTSSSRVRPAASTTDPGRLQRHYPRRLRADEAPAGA